MKFTPILFGLFIVYPAFSQKDQAFKTLQGTAQGTTFSISYQDSKRRDFTGEIDSLFGVIDQSMSLWVKNSLINTVNQNKPYERLDPHFIKVFDASLEVSKKTGGYFDMTVGPLVKAWGFGAKKNVVHPDNRQVDSLKVYTGYKKIKRKGHRIVKDHPSMEIDFNAIAQGYSVDVMGDFLLSKGISHWLVEIGGEIKAHGRNAENLAWKAGIEKPGKSEEQEADIQVVVALQNKALGTSGSYRKFFEQDGRKYSHSIDPFSGKPVSHSVLSITALSDDAMTADALAKGFLVMGLEKARATAARIKADFFAIYEENGQMKTYATPGFSKIIVHQ